MTPESQDRLRRLKMSTVLQTDLIKALKSGYFPARSGKVIEPAIEYVKSLREVTKEEIRKIETGNE